MKDLVEAHSFSRRRLVAAFISGAPDRREVEPGRPARALVGGLALAVLLIAGAAVGGMLSPRVDDDWKEEGLVTSQEKATDYLILDAPDGEKAELRPLLNITSAMLLFGADVAATPVPEEELDTLEEGPPIGILDAPGAPPHADDLIRESWTACTAMGSGIKLHVSESEATEAAPDVGFLVRRDDDHFVIGESEPEGSEDPRAHRYPVRVSGDNSLSDTTLDVLSGSGIADAVEVPADWLRLFPRGAALAVDGLGLGAIGEPATYRDTGGIPGNAKIGDYYVLGDSTYAIGQHAPTKLTPFAAELLREAVGDKRELTVDDVSLRLGAGLLDGTHWPAEPLAPSAGELCAELVPGAETPGVRLAQHPAVAASVQAAEVDFGLIERSVDSGGGALVLSGRWKDEVGTKEAHLIDSAGRSHLLKGPSVPELLGYGEVEALTAHRTWLELFEDGVTLSVTAAGCAPASDGQQPCSSDER